MRNTGIFILAPIAGEARESIRATQQRYDPKFAANYQPHLTLVGSSGIGPIVGTTTSEAIRAALAPIAANTAPLALSFGRPYRFMQTNIVSLPLDPHGPLRELHDRIGRCGLTFLPARFTFTPHVTLTLYPELTKAREKELLALRVTEPAIIDRLVISKTDEPQPPRVLFELPLQTIV